MLYFYCIFSYILILFPLFPISSQILLTCSLLTIDFPIPSCFVNSTPIKPYLLPWDAVAKMYPSPSSVFKDIMEMGSTGA